MARIFWSGRSQAVRLPKEFRFFTSEVEIRKEGNEVILEPVKKREWPRGYWEMLLASAPEDIQLPQDLPPKEFSI